MINRAKKSNVGTWNEIWVGHTSTQSIERYHVTCVCKHCHKEWREYLATECVFCKSEEVVCAFGKMEPIQHHNVHIIDCGAGANGKLCLYDLETKKYWLSRMTEDAW